MVVETSGPTRTFFALWPDEPSRAALSALARAVAHDRGGRATAAANLHVTIAFVGQVPASRLAALAEAGRASVDGRGAFDLALERLGGAAQGIAWIAPASVPPELVALHGALKSALAGRDFAVEARRFRPHVTLARRCGRRPLHRATEPIAWRVERLSLVRSVGGPDGSRYDDLDAWPLRGSRQSTDTV
jgi:2'-5' RNA ligase